MVNARSLQLEGARLLYESLLVPVLMYGSETMIWREKSVEMDYLRCLLGIRGMDKILNALIRQISGVMKGVDEK